MSEPIGYGIDFGTTNSSIAVAYSDHVEVIEVTTKDPVMSRAMPSTVYLHRSGDRSAGRQAVEQYLITGSRRTSCARCDLVSYFNEVPLTDCLAYRPNGNCPDARILAGIKSDLADPGFTETHSWAQDFTLADLTSVVLRELKRRADEHTRSDIRKVVIGHPVAFMGSEGEDFQVRQGLAIQRLASAAEKAGFEDVMFAPEPAAAVMDEALPFGVSVAVDFGGGTFDVAAMKVDEEGAEVTSMQGAAIGGERFDELVFDAKVADQLGLHDTYTTPEGKHLQLPQWFQHGMASLRQAVHLLNNPAALDVLAAFRAYRGGHGLDMVGEILRGGHMYDFYREIERAKIALSTETETEIDFRRPGIQVSATVTRAELDELISPYLDVVGTQIDRAVSESGTTRRDVHTVIRTGGSSQLVAFVNRLQEMFPVATIRERPAFTTVARGLGVMAQEEWGR